MLQAPKDYAEDMTDQEEHEDPFDWSFWGCLVLVGVPALAILSVGIAWVAVHSL